MADVLVIGAGPSGLAAAAAAVRRGAQVTVLDAAGEVGGQFWRHLPASRPSGRERVLHHDWAGFGQLVAALPPDVRLNAQVWAIEREPGHLAVQVAPAGGGTTVTLRPDRLVLATGAHERVLPVPGWTLPGVYTAGAAQAFAKAERIALGRQVVVSGAGPFLLPVARSLTQAGAAVAGIYEASGPARLVRGWGSRPWQVLGSAHKLAELGGYATHLLADRIGYHPGHQVVEIHGGARVEAVTVARLDAGWRPVAGTRQQLACDAVCLAHGFTPRLELPIAAGCKLTPDRFVAVDDGQRTSVAGVLAAGELTAIGGADLALASGEIAGWVAAGGAPEDAELRRAQRRRTAALQMAARIEAAHGIRPGWLDWPAPDTVLCRCEQVSFGAVDAALEATCADGLRSVKLTTRVGMGLCQGRVCGRNAEQYLLARRGRDSFADQAGTDRRPITVPINLGDLARLAPAADDRKADS